MRQHRNALLAQVAYGNSDEDDTAHDHELPEEVHARQDQCVVHHGKQKRAHDGAVYCSATAEQAGSANDDRGDDMYLHGVSDRRLGGINSGHHDQSAQSREQSHQRVDHDLDPIHRNTGETRCFPVAADSFYIEAEASAVEKPCAKYGGGKRDDHRHRHAGDFALADKG